ncbi:MAG: cyclophilin-like fold protein [Candidatus Coproplasma sp.]
MKRLIAEIIIFAILTPLFFIGCTKGGALNDGYTPSDSTRNQTPDNSSEGDIVLFYKSFTTPYSYTQIGSVDDVEGLEQAVGTQSVTVTFQIK